MKDVIKTMMWLITNGDDEVTDIMAILLMISVIADVIKWNYLHIETFALFKIIDNVSVIFFITTISTMVVRLIKNIYILSESSEEDGFLSEEG